MLKISLLSILTTALFYNALIFIANKGDLSIPDVPFFFKVLKDGIVVTAIFLPFLLNRALRLKMPRIVFFYILFSFAIGLIMVSIAIVKFGIDSRLLGILKNYLVYYPASGLLAFWIHRYGKERYFFDVFRLLMFVVLLLGLLFYFIATRDMVFTYSGRMISSLGNPNYLGYFSLLYIFVLFGVFYSQSDTSFRIIAELIVAHLGLFLSLSYAAILCYAVTLVVMFVIWNLKLMIKNGLLIKLVIIGVLGSVIGSSAVFAMRFFRNGIFSVAFKEKVSPLSNGSIMHFQSVQVRIGAFSSHTAELFSSLKSFLFGAFREKQYVETDGAFLNLAYNFGVPVFVAWLVYFILPVYLAAASFKKMRTSEDPNAAMTFMLSILISSSLLTHFWIQYLPEKFPACLFIGFVLSYILINTLQMKQADELSHNIVAGND